MARTTGKAAVCFATSGPGATNLLTAIADAKLDSVPIIAITGQVSYPYVGTDSFQEVDTYGLTIPITKHNFLVRSAEELFRIIPEAFSIAEGGRPGPVLIDIPKNVQSEIIEFNEFPNIKIEEKPLLIKEEDVIRAVKMINDAKKPMLYIGGGIANSDSVKLLYEFAKKNSIPVTSTLLGKGAFPIEDSLYLGMLGMHGARYTNLLINEADLILAFGVRFDDRAIGNVDCFCKDAKIIHVDIDDAEIDKIRKVDIAINGEISSFLKLIIPLIEDNKREEWLNTVYSKKQEKPFLLPQVEEKFHPINIIKRISEIVGEEAIVATDVGQHQMWTAQVYPIKKPRTFLTSGGLGTMGFGLPTAIGAAISNPDKTIVCFTGDGSILMNIQELATLSDFGFNVKVVILNNGHLGLVRQQQELFYNKHYMASKFISSTDFAAVAKGFGVNGYTIKKGDEIDSILTKVLTEKGPALIDIYINSNENVYPMVPPGKGISEMVGGE
jgi:acetolactate synthase-1/2/3 large subunit